MICQQFEQLVHQIAHNELRDAKLLQDANFHAAGCAACNELLIEARDVAASVALLAAHDKALDSAAHLEFTLRAAFVREHATNSGLVSVDSARRANFGGANFRWTALSLAAAAVILAVIFLPRIIHRNSGQDIAKQIPAHPSSPSVNAAKPAPVTVPTQAADVPKEVPEHEAPKHLVAAHKPRKHLAEPEKTLTGFLALPYADDLSTVEYGAVVRMQMSRADLAWLGLPVPVSDSGQKIVADLFVNGSGTPEAIRLVR